MASTDQRQRGPQRSSRVSGAIDRTATQPHRAGFFFDFDGTLAPIQEDPETVQPVPGVLAPLARLCSLVGRVGVVSARPVEFLRPHFAGLPMTLHGLYGLESSRAGGEVETVPAAVPWIPVVRELTEQARAELPPGVRVEYKRLSVGLHFRSAPELGDQVQAWAERQAARLGLRLQAGRMVIELKPPVQRDKGSVLGEEIGDLACCWYFGDDVADLAAFGALAEREDAGDGFVGVRVAVANPETDSVTGAADLVLDSPAAISALLTEVADAIGEPRDAG
jgi:trehalose 6-phosphate phosphatase